MSQIYQDQTIENYVVHKELRADLFSVSAMNPFPGHISASRIQMFASHLSQKLNILEPTLRYTQTGMEYEFGKSTLNIKMSHNAGIIRVIPRYTQTMDKNSIEENPQDIVIYEDRDTNKIHILDIPRFCSYHQHFGFDYVKGDVYDKIYPQSFVPKDSVIVDAPSKAKNGGYMFARDIAVAFMSHESIAEDGIMICRDVLDKFKYKTYETRVVEWGAKKFPLNLYGSIDKYKAFPDIGDYLRDDNMLMAFRTLDKTLAPVEQNVYEMMMVNQNFDKVVYGAGPGGKIIDIKVYASSEAGTNTLEGTDEQIEKYKNATDVFYTKIFEEYQRLRKERGNNLKISEEFHRLLVEAQGAIKPLTNPRLIKLHKRVPIDDYRVEFTIEYTHTPRDGSKFTDCAGGTRFR